MNEELIRAALSAYMSVDDSRKERNKQRQMEALKNIQVQSAILRRIDIKDTEALANDISDLKTLTKTLENLLSKIVAN